MAQETLTGRLRNQWAARGGQRRSVVISRTGNGGSGWQRLPTPARAGKFEWIEKSLEVEAGEASEPKGVEGQRKACGGSGAGGGGSLVGAGSQQAQHGLPRALTGLSELPKSPACCRRPAKWHTLCGMCPRAAHVAQRSPQCALPPPPLLSPSHRSSGPVPIMLPTSPASLTPPQPGARLFVLGWAGRARGLCGQSLQAVDSPPEPWQG